MQTQTTTERPAVAVDSRNRKIVTQQRKREKAIQRLARLREKASAEIDRLIAFMDASEPYVQDELEAAVDDEPCDTDELEPGFCGIHATAIKVMGPWPDNHGDELEADYGFGQTTDDEPSLGWSTTGAIGEATDNELDASDDEPSLCGVTVETIGCGRDLEYDSGDEPELVNEDGDDADKEPSLGWREGMVQVIGHSYDDREAGVGPRTPQYRTEIDGPQVKVEVSYRRFVSGLTPAQRKALKQRQPKAKGYGSFGDVVL